MDNSLLALDKAIIHSIAEQSLDKINDYFESSTVAKNLNSETLSLLLKSLEKENRSNEDKIVNIKCVLHCLGKFLEFKQNLSSWEYLSEDISKLCQLCFCISVNLANEDLIEINISVLGQMIHVNKNLTNNIFGYLLEPCLTALSMYCKSSDNPLLCTLSNLTSSLCENASRMKRNEIVPMVTHHLNMLSNLLILCGDYETQAAIVEVLARCKSSIVPSTMSLGSNEKLNLFSCSTKISEEFNKYSFVKFDPECRLFLNEFNESLGDKQKVFSVPCVCLVYNCNTLKKPKDKGYMSFWVDFNIARKRISFYHELPDATWAIESVPFKEVVNVTAKDSVCTTKHANKNIDSVKVELTLCKSIIVLERIELLKLYCRKIQFDMLHRILSIVFPDMYKCYVDISFQDEIGLGHNMLGRLSSSNPLMVVSNPEETNKPLSPLPSKSDKIGLDKLKQSMQQNVMCITPTSDKQKCNKKGPFTENYSNVSNGVNSNREFLANVDCAKKPCSLHKNNCEIKLGEAIYMKPNNRSVVVNSNIEKTPELLKSLVDSSLSKDEASEISKDPAGYKHLNTKERTVKRKRLYSVENEDSHVKSIVLSSQDETQPLNESKKLMSDGNRREKDCFWNKNNTYSRVATQKKKYSHIFTDENASDNSIPYVDSFTSNKKMEQMGQNLKRADEKLLASNETHKHSKFSNLFTGSVFSDVSLCTKGPPKRNYERKTYTRQKGKKFTASFLPSSSYCDIKESEKKVPNKRVFRRRSELLNKVDVIDTSKSSISETNNETDSDYIPTCNIRGTEDQVPTKRVLRKRNKPLNKVYVVDTSKSNKCETIVANSETSPCLVETNEDSPLHTKLKKPKSCSTTNNSTTYNRDNLSTSFTNESNSLSKNIFKGGQDFHSRIVSSSIVEPTRNETFCKDIEIIALQPEDDKILPKRKTHDSQCEIEDPVFTPVDLDLTDPQKLPIFDRLLPSNSKLETKRLTKGKPTSSWNMEVDEMPTGTHNDLLCNEMNLMQTFKIDDILELSQKTVSNFKNNIKSSLIQSQEKRRQYLNEYELQLKNTRNSILENCERLEVNCSKLNELKVSLEKTLVLQHDLIGNIQGEIANLDEAKEQLFKKEGEVKDSETLSIVNLFKNIGIYVRRLLFTSFRENV